MEMEGAEGSTAIEATADDEIAATAEELWLVSRRNDS
jgi:hypothetical protein